MHNQNSNLRELRHQANEVVNAYACIASSIALVTSPVPLSSGALVATEVLLVWHLAKHYKLNISPVEFLSSASALVVVAKVTRHLFHEILTFVPGIGWLIKPLLAFGFCKFLGAIAIDYFSEQHTLRREISDSD